MTEFQSRFFSFWYVDRIFILFLGAINIPDNIIKKSTRVHVRMTKDKSQTERNFLLLIFLYKGGLLIS